MSSKEYANYINCLEELVVMPRPKASQKNVRKLGKIGKQNHSSYYVTLPIDLVRKFGWKESQKLTVRKGRGRNKIIIEDYEE